MQAEGADRPTIQRLLDLGLLACCILVAMVAMTIYFSQSVYQISPESERITRLHGRYYVYVLPLFMLVIIALWQNGSYGGGGGSHCSHVRDRPCRLP